jgi:hypothetical protein
MVKSFFSQTPRSAVTDKATAKKTHVDKALVAQITTVKVDAFSRRQEKSATAAVSKLWS